MINEISGACGMTQKEAEAALDAILTAIPVYLSRGYRVSFRGFGSFYCLEKPERDGVNPATGEPIRIAARTAVKFKPAKGILD